MKDISADEESSDEAAEEEKSNGNEEQRSELQAYYRERQECEQASMRYDLALRADMRAFQGHKEIWHNQEKTKKNKDANDPDKRRRENAKFKGICIDGGAQRSAGGLKQHIELLKITGLPKSTLKAPTDICSAPSAGSKELLIGLAKMRLPMGEWRRFLWIQMQYRCDRCANSARRWCWKKRGKSFMGAFTATKAPTTFHDWSIIAYLQMPAAGPAYRIIEATDFQWASC